MVHYNILQVNHLLDDDKPLLLKTGETRKPTEKNRVKPTACKHMIYISNRPKVDVKAPPWTSFRKCPNPRLTVLLVNPHRHPSVSRGENLGKNSAGERVVAGSGENDVVGLSWLVALGWVGLGWVG